MKKQSRANQMDSAVTAFLTPRKQKNAMMGGYAAVAARMEKPVSRSRIVLAAHVRRKATMDVATSAKRNSAATAFCKQKRTAENSVLLHAPSEKSATCRVAPALQSQRVETMLLK